MNIKQQISAYNKMPRYGASIQYIVVHDTGVQGQTAQNNLDYFSGGDRQASAHFFVDSAMVGQSVEENMASWHCGDGGGIYGITNYNSIGIEMCPQNNCIPQATQDLTIELILYLQKKYNVSNDRVVRHYDASRKNCPQFLNRDGNWSGWIAFKNKLVSGTSTTIPTTTASNSNSSGIGSGLTNATTWQKTDTDVNVYISQTTKSKVHKKIDKNTVFKSSRYANGENVDGQGYKWFEFTGGGWIYGAYITPTTAQTTEPTASASGWKAENGNFRCNTAIIARSISPSVLSPVFYTFQSGDVIKYDAYLISGGFVWIRQKRGDGSYVYLPTGNFDGTKRTSTWGTFY